MAFTAARSQAFADDELRREIAAFERASGLARRPSCAAQCGGPLRATLRSGRAVGRISLPMLGRQDVIVHGPPALQADASRTAGAALGLRERRSCSRSQVVGGGGRWSCHILSARRCGSTRAARAARTPVTEMSAGVLDRYAS